MTRVSIAMAVYNGNKFIAEQLESLLSQTYVPAEIIICDDSRNNDTFNAIEPLAKASPDIIKYHRNDIILGVSGNFAKAISLCSGDIIMLCDQDDVWLPDKVQKLTGPISEMEQPVGCFCNSSLVDVQLNPLNTTHWYLRGFTGNIITEYCKAGLSAKLEMFCRRVPIAGHNMAFGAELKDILLPFPNLPECHDTWIGLVIAAISEWLIIPECLTLFRQHESNLSQSGRYNQLQKAANSIKKNTFDWNAKLYAELIGRLNNGNFPIDPAISVLLADRHDHSATRAAMNCSLLKRLPLICEEIRNRRYFKYARGWKSVVQDFIIRSFT